MDDHIFRLFKEGKIDEPEALDHSHNAGQMRERIDAFRKGQPFDATQPDVEEPDPPAAKGKKS